MRSIVLALLLLPALALAQAAVPAPRLLPYQGRLLTSSGTPETGPQWLTFRIYGAPDATTALWTEAQSVPLMNGFYAVFLGAVSTFPDSLFDGHDRWLGVTVGDGSSPELTPRQQLASVAYAVTSTNAFRATTADQATKAATADYATKAGVAASANYAAEAGTAANAAHANLCAQADRAAIAASATQADTATSVSGSGDVNAARIHATSDVTADNVIQGGEVRTTGDVYVGKNLQLQPGGQILGGGPRIVGLVSATTGLSTSDSCNAAGAGKCLQDPPDYVYQAQCSVGQAVTLFSYGNKFECDSSSTGTGWCNWVWLVACVVP